ncbi:ARM repeat-containing protein [Haematococcus lacustris]
MASVTGWAPQEAGVLQLCNLFRDLQQGLNQAQILKQLDEYRAYPDFDNYLAFIFAQGDQVPIDVRQAAGLYLKNDLKHHFVTTTDSQRQYLKDVLLQLVAHPEKSIRQTAGTCISVVVVHAGFATWPQMVQAMQACLSSSDLHAITGGLDTLYKIVEESPVQMDVTLAQGPGGPSTATTVSCVLVPPLLQLLQHSSADVRCQACACLNLMARDQPLGIANNSDRYVHGLFGLAHDSSSAVRAEVCRGLVALLTVQPDKLQPFMAQVIEYMLASNEMPDASVALESCEFWIAFCEAQLGPEVLQPYLTRLVPLLMKNMVFEASDEVVVEAEEEEAAGAAGRQDRASELRPQHHKQARAQGEGQQGPGLVEGEEEEDDDDDEVTNSWTLRKCSAAGLDHLSNVYGDALLPVLLPIVEQRLACDDWRARESAILALGAVAQGCHQGLRPHLPGMVTMLLPKLGDPRPMVRIITCWALSRYSAWMLAGVQAAGAASGASNASSQTPEAAQLTQVVEGLLHRVMDHNKFVQEAACGAVAQLCESCKEGPTAVLQPYLQGISSVLGSAVAQYGRRNLRCACDAIIQLVEVASASQPGGSQLQAVLLPLCNRMAGLGPHDTDLIPILECLTSVTPLLGRQLDSLAQPLYQSALQLVMTQEACRQQQQQQTAAGGGAQAPGAAAAAPAAEEYDVDIHVLGLDLLAALAEGLGEALLPLVAPDTLSKVLLSACCAELPDVRQSGFALLGDLTKGCISLLLPLLHDLVVAALTCLAPANIHQKSMKACNNAAWSLGELSLKLSPEQVVPWADRAAEQLAGLLMRSAAAGSGQPGAPQHRLPHSLLENASIALGRLALVAPAPIAPHLSHFCVAWCQALRNVRDDVEKEHAFLGLCALVQANPQAALAPPQNFHALAAALVSWRVITSAALRQAIKGLLGGLQATLAAAGQWQGALDSLGTPTATKLLTLC